MVGLRKRRLYTLCSAPFSAACHHMMRSRTERDKPPIINAEIDKLKEQGVLVMDSCPTEAIMAAIRGKPDSLVEGGYYVKERKFDVNIGDVRIGAVAASDYVVSQVLDKHVLYQNKTSDLPPILLEAEEGKLYLKGQGLHLATRLMYEYVGSTSYESVTGAQVQALIFRPVVNEEFDRGVRILESANK